MQSCKLLYNVIMHNVMLTIVMLEYYSPSVQPPLKLDEASEAHC